MRFGIWVLYESCYCNCERKEEEEEYGWLRRIEEEKVQKMVGWGFIQGFANSFSGFKLLDMGFWV